MCQITLTNIEYPLSEFKFSTGIHLSRPSWESVTYILHVAHKIPLRCAQINLLNVNSMCLFQCVLGNMQGMFKVHDLIDGIA